MHEQKLLEVSITGEELAQAAEAYARQGNRAAADTLRQDRATLLEMEAQAERFGQAVGLDSASTFESIVDGPRHYFMEVNTRIQVEHRVTEMVYSLRFRNPDAPERPLEVDSLVEAMLWLAVHGKALPRPERVPRHGSGVEARINATNDALKPHAGGVVLSWSPPLPDELRDDQGVGIRNPDTGTFMPYRLAGAYDSNIALVVTHGSSRADSFQRLAERLRVTEIRGEDVQTNLGFHYGLLHWMLGAEPMVKPSTRFVRGYLAAVGHLKFVANEIDLDSAWTALVERATGPGEAALLEAKQTLVPRPLARLWAQPHLLAGWLARGVEAPEPLWERTPGGIVWRRNPLEVLERLYRHLRMEDHPGVSAEERIWRQDQTLLDVGLSFYRDLSRKLRGERPWPELTALLGRDDPPPGFARGVWAQVQGAHRGHQLGLDLLKLPVVLGGEAGFFRLRVAPDLEAEVPADLFDEEAAAPALLALAPPPPAHAGEIVAPTGGTFYARPSPEAEPHVMPQQHVEAGDVVGLLEVMKMFNPVRAPFACTIAESLVTATTGAVVHKGQALFRVVPDHVALVADPAAQERHRRAFTLSLLAKC
jgi:biotin carboxyl carrier protein